MQLLPRSLFGRSTLLIAALILISQLITSALFLYWVLLPRAQIMANMADSHLHSIRTALSIIPVQQRNNYITQLGKSHHLHLQTQAPSIDSKVKAPSFALKKFLQLFEKKLKPQEQLIYQKSPVQAIWVKISIEQQPYWVMFSAAQFNVSLIDHWLDLSIAMVLLALIGGIVIHRTLNQPLQHLSAAVNRIGAGQRIDHIQEEGPAEIVHFIRTLNRMNSALKNMEDDRAMMLAGISHDLRTPVTRIQLAIEMIGGDFDADLKTRVMANLAEIENGLNQCLDFARNFEDETPKLADLNDLARLCAASYKANGHDIKLDLCEEAQTLMRPFAMQRLLKNLIDNAIKYANGEISIATQRENGKPENNKLCLSILDRGAGIAEADIEKLRRPFMRADIARADTTGYGLGLAIVDKIVEAHQAKISFLQRPSGGLEVLIEFNA